MKIYYLLLTLLLLGCTSVGTRQIVIEPPVEESPLELGRDLHWMRNSAEFKAIALQTYRLAAERLRELVADKKPGTWAVAADADETVIDASGYTKMVILMGLPPSNYDHWDAWVARHADSPVPGAINFLKLVHELGGRIAIVTNRSDKNCPDTKANFLTFDIPFDVMLCKGEDSQKEPRWEEVEKGTTSAGLPPLEIVMWLGDNIHDFPEFDQHSRLEGEEAFISFGDRYFAFPNPTYGSWEGNPRD
jgi:5'-nucleotidase (lipoprotein e(P4) family)